MPWISPRLISLSYVVTCILLAYPLYLLMITSNSILPSAAFHGVINALWRVPQFVTKIRNEYRNRDIAKSISISILSWSIAIVLTLILIHITDTVVSLIKLMRFSV